MRVNQYAEAANAILKEENKPLTARVIVKLAVEREFLHPGGPNPEATMSSILGTGIRTKGKKSRFAVLPPAPGERVAKYCLRENDTSEITIVCNSCGHKIVYQRKVK